MSSTGVQFAGLTASLRAPRVAVAVEADEHWAWFAGRALDFLSHTWGGASGVIVFPAPDGSLPGPAMRLLRRYDPDYVVNLALSYGDVEALRPGWQRLIVDGVDVPEEDRLEFIGKIEMSGPHVRNYVSSDDAMRSLTAALSTFKEDDGSQRVDWVHPGMPAPDPLSDVAVPDDLRVAVDSGDQLIDLALRAKLGSAIDPVATVSVRAKSVSRYRIASTLANDDSFRLVAPFDATRNGLVSVATGYVDRDAPLVVFGSTEQDLSLAMLWDRLAGTGLWLPVTHRHTTWHDSLGVALDHARLRGDGHLRITSTSLSQAQCQALMTKLWNARWISDPSGPLDPWTWTAPDQLEVPSGRLDLRVRDKWDERFSAPMTVGSDGSSEMAATFPLIAPEPTIRASRWIVDAAWPEHPIKVNAAITAAELFAHDQDQHETFVRPSASGISFESARWDFVHAGASRFGQLAQPKLRWPGTLNMLRAISAPAQLEVRPSHAGRVGQITAELWGGRDRLADDLRGKHRTLLDTFSSDRSDNGPADRGSGINDENCRIILQGVCLVPFAALTRAADAVVMTPSEVRRWVDDRLATGAIRMGLILNCEVCPWVGFYRIGELGDTYTCTRCGSQCRVTSKRWRKPLPAPIWYYDLHPTAREFLAQNGDIPVLAVRRYSDTERVHDAQFELELVKVGDSKPTTELDFAFMTRRGLTVGEAKRSGDLDGANAKARVRDVAKLLDAASALDVDEVCYASATTWSTSARAAIQTAAAEHHRSVTISILENLSAENPSVRTVIHGLAGP